jgi:hypothetical protein
VNRKTEAPHGSDALPHLITLIQGDNLGLAAKAASLSGSINAGESAAVLEIAANHPEVVVRVAAAASANSLTNIPTTLALTLLNDSDAGVRKWTLKALEAHHPPGIRRKLEEMITSDPDIGLRDRAKHIIKQLSELE